MSKILVLVADSSRARFFSTDMQRGALTELDDLVHDQSRMHERDLISDAPGSSLGGGGQARHGIEAAGGVKEHEAIVFAREIATYLDNALEQKQFDNLAIVAAPSFLGHLRANISKNVKGRVSLEIDKDITQMTVDQIRDHLPERIPVL